MSDLTLDQRLGRLTERHETLRSFIENLALTVRKTKELVGSQGRSAEEFAGLMKSRVDTGERIRVLLHTAEIHERRLT